MIRCEMSKKAGAKTAGTTAVTFTLAHVDLSGHKLAVVGDFNDWDPYAAPMDRVDGGAWSATVDVSPGRYRFRYLAEDGQWFNDEAAHDYQDNEHGGQDGILDLAGQADAAEASSEESSEEQQLAGAQLGM